MSKKVLLTGASGLVGKEAIAPLIESGFDVFAVYSKTPIPQQEKLTPVKADICNTNDVTKIFAEIKPEYLLHFAWYTGDGYLTSDINYKLKDAGLFMLNEFKKQGGKRAVYTGTCFEYEFKNTPLKEDDPLNPATVYAKCKNELRIQAQQFAAQHNLSFGWGRIFYVVGHNEHKNRLLPVLVDTLTNNKTFTTSNGPLLRDYMYSKDIAAAFVKFLDSTVSGCVNICTGQGISIKDFVLKTAEKLGKQNLVEFKDDIKDQPPLISGNNTRLVNEVRYVQTNTIDTAFENILAQIHPLKKQIL
jgi:nucleoside-diphosphate-sugar epimerase